MLVFPLIFLLATFAAPAYAGDLSVVAAETAPYFEYVTEGDKDYFLKIKAAVENDNREWIADQIDFPLQWDVDPKRKSELIDKSKFIENYELIVDARLRRAISEQNPEDLFKNWMGIMVGRGEVWFMQVSAVKLTYRIRKIGDCHQGKVEITAVNP